MRDRFLFTAKNSEVYVLELIMVEEVIWASGVPARYVENYIDPGKVIRLRPNTSRAGEETTDIYLFDMGNSIKVKGSLKEIAAKINAARKANGDKPGKKTVSRESLMDLEE